MLYACSACNQPMLFTGEWCKTCKDNQRKATEAKMLSPMNLEKCTASLHGLFRLYKLAEPEGDTLTFFSWIKDELQIY